jgi:hypothetical protein
MRHWPLEAVVKKRERQFAAEDFYAMLQQAERACIFVCALRRCATQVAGIAAHCEQCGWDVCCDCATALREQVEAAAASSATNVALQVTCCNPQCSKQIGSSAESEQSPCPVRIPMQQQGGVAGQQVGGNRMATGAEEGGLEEEEEGEEEEEPCVVRQGLFSLPGNAPLQLQLVLPPDLLDSLGELLELAKVGEHVERWR